MAKIMLSFDLDNGDDIQDVNYALYGAALADVLTKLDEWLRRKAKYEDITFVSIDDMRRRLREETEDLPVVW